MNAAPRVPLDETIVDDVLDELERAVGITADGENVIGFNLLGNSTFIFTNNGRQTRRIEREAAGDVKLKQMYALRGDQRAFFLRNIVVRCFFKCVVKFLPLARRVEKQIFWHFACFEFFAERQMDHCLVGPGRCL